MATVSASGECPTSGASGSAAGPRYVAHGRETVTQHTAVVTAIAAIVLVAVCVGARSMPVASTQRSDAVRTLLQSTSVRVEATDDQSGRRTSCEGFVYDTGPTRGSYEVAYVITAAHCLRSSAVAPKIIGGTGFKSTVRACALLESGAKWLQANDILSPDDPAVDIALLTVVSPKSVSSRSLRMLTGADKPKALHSHWFWAAPGPPDEMPVMSMLSAGGGLIVPSSGMMHRNRDGTPGVFIPVAPGTSGALVVDLEARIVGMVVTGLTYVSDGAGMTAGIIPASTIVSFASRDIRLSQQSAKNPTPCAL